MKGKRPCVIVRPTCASSSVNTNGLFWTLPLVQCLLTMKQGGLQLVQVGPCSLTEPRRALANRQDRDARHCAELCDAPLGLRERCDPQAGFFGGPRLLTILFPRRRAAHFYRNQRRTAILRRGGCQSRTGWPENESQTNPPSPAWWTRLRFLQAGILHEGIKTGQARGLLRAQVRLGKPTPRAPPRWACEHGPSHPSPCHSHARYDCSMVFGLRAIVAKCQNLKSRLDR